MELSNKRVSYSVLNSNEAVSLRGEVTISETGLISTFTGTFNDADGRYCGDFYCNEPESGILNKNLSNIKLDKEVEASALLMNTVKMLKEESN